jgi:purine catabolism regulator
MAPIIVRDVLRLALPAGTTVVAGSAGLSHQVSWVAALRATPPAFLNLRGGELALVPVDGIKALDDRLTLAELIERLASVPVAAIAVLGEPSDADRAAADAARLPLLHLPGGASLREVEREVQRLITDYEAQVERRAAQLASLLTQRSLGGAGLGGLLETLVERTGQAAACYTAYGETRAIRGRGSGRVALQTLRPTAPGATTQLGQAVWVQPLGAAGDRLGFVALAGAELDEWDRVAAQQAATAIALELAKEQAVQAAEERLRGDFVQAVLMGPPGDTEALHRRAAELGYDLRLPHTALLCSVAPAASNGAADDAVARAVGLINAGLASLGLAAPTMRRGDGVLCYLPHRDTGPRPRELAEQLRRKLAPELPQVVLALGKEAPSVAAWPHSLREAEQALRIGRQLFETSRVLEYGDLGVYRLLLLLREQSELWEFYRATLAPIVEYDREQRAELVKTLEAFFDHLGNLARTAGALHVHRNTLIYRIERISEISGMDLDDAEDRLALWLALKAHRVLHTLDGDEEA